MLWYTDSATFGGSLKLLGRDAAAAFLPPGRYRFWASFSELDKPEFIASEVLIAPGVLTSISVEWSDHQQLRLWGFGVGITGLGAWLVGVDMRKEGVNDVGTAFMIGGGAVLGLGVLLIALGMRWSEGFKATIEQKPAHEAGQ